MAPLHPLGYAYGSSQIKKLAARLSRRIAVEERKYVPGMADTQN